MSLPFVTSDVDLAAALRCNNLHYHEIRPGARFAEFTFPASERVLSLAHAWASGEPCLVDAREFGRTRRVLMKQATRVQEGARS